MKLGVVGTGYVGLVTGTCFAEMGNDVTCVDIDAEKVTRMQAGEVPIHEPKLPELFRKNIDEGRLSFTTDLAEGVSDADAIFLALPTPEDKDGSADLSAVLSVAEKLGPLLSKYAVIVDKSTVPPGTAERVKERVGRHAKVEFDVVSNPEFLREGQAVNDFLAPDRILIGTDSDRAFKVMNRLYRPFVMREPQRILRMDATSAELAKYAANALLASRISFMDELSSVAEAVGADIVRIRTAVGSDHRIGPEFLYAGPGWGGSCFPKDTKALAHIATEHNKRLAIVEATIEANEVQKRQIPNKVSAYFGGNLEGRTLALWGLAFKKDTDDIRESPALTVIDELISQGATIVGYDPEAMDNIRKRYADQPKLVLAHDQYEATKGADALIIITDWSVFKSPDFKRLKGLLNGNPPAIFDGRNLYDLDDMAQAGVHYESIGRRTVG